MKNRPNDVFVIAFKNNMLFDENFPRNFVKSVLNEEDCHAGNNKTLDVPEDKLPTSLVEIEPSPDSDDTVDIYLDNGWQLAVKIENENDIHYRVRFVSVPEGVTIIER